MRLRFRRSSGEVRVPARNAGVFMKGATITRPWIVAGSSSRVSACSATGPSYSSPWFAPVRSAVGPSPLRITEIGIITDPQALSSRL